MTDKTHSQARPVARSRETKKLSAEVRRRINRAAHASALIFEAAEVARLRLLAELPAPTAEEFAKVLERK